MSRQRVSGRSSGAEVGAFVGVVLGLSGLYWLLFALRARGWVPFDPSSDVAGAARGYTPAVAAIVTTLAFTGREGLAALTRRVTRWRVAPGLYALALLGPLAAGLAALLGARLSGTVTAFAPDAIPLAKLLIVFVFFAVVDGPIGEEIGWRGFLLPKLLERQGPLKASLLVGMVWYLWHLPLYLATGRFDMSVSFLLGYLAQNLAWSFLHTWFFRRSGGSAFLAVFLHTAGNYSVYLLITLFPMLEQAPATEATYVAAVAAAALCAAAAMWRQRAGGRGDLETGAEASTDPGGRR